MLLRQLVFVFLFRFLRCQIFSFFLYMLLRKILTIVTRFLYQFINITPKDEVITLKMILSSVNILVKKELLHILF